jgi:excisionase family DNA binding protein
MYASLYLTIYNYGYLWYKYPSNMPDLSFLTVQEVAQILKLNILTIYEYIRNHKLQAIKFGRKYRIQRSTLEEFVKSNIMP